VSLIGQVLLLRELLVASFGIELVCLLGLAALLLGTAAGATLARRARGGPERAVLLLAALSLSLPLLTAFARAQRLLLGGLPGTLLSPLSQLAGVVLPLLPFGALGGALFAVSARIHQARGGSAGSAYAWESVGGIAGGMAATGLLIAGVSGTAGALLGSVPGLVIAAICAPRRRVRTLLATLALASLVVFPGLGGWDRSLSRAQHPHLVACADTPYGRIAVDRVGESVSVFLNDALVSDTQGTAAEEFVHPSALQVAAPRKVLLVGGALEGLACEVLKHHPESVDLIEVDERAFRTAEPFLPLPWREALASPVTHLRFEDPRRALKAGGPWDLVLIGMPEPDSGATNRYYTRDFFRECAAHMSPGAALALRLGASESLWTRLWLRRTASVESALAGAFPHRLALPGPTLLLLASQTPLSRDPSLLADRWRQRQIATRLVAPPYLRYLLTSDRVDAVALALGATPSSPNTDARPVCYPFTIRLWASRLAPALGNRDPLSPLTGHPFAASLLLLGSLVAAGAALRRRPGPSALLLVAGAGAAGMALEGALLLAYQAQRGVLYQDLGLLLMAFMAGLAAGSALASGRDERRTRRGALALLWMGAAAAAALWSAGRWPGLALTLLLMASTGSATGAIFAAAAGGRGPDALGALYASDLLGAILGALGAGLLLIPFAGLPATALLVSLLALALLTLRAGP